MGKFEKAIHYLDLYENNEKSGVAGCAEIITRGDTVSLKVSLRTSRQVNQQPIKVYGVQNTASLCKLKELARGEISQEGYSFTKRYQKEDEELQYLSGIYVFVNHRLHIIGIWNTAEEVFRHYPEMLKEAERQMLNSEGPVESVLHKVSGKPQSGSIETKGSQIGWNEAGKNEAGKNEAGKSEAEKNETDKNQIRKNEKERETDHKEQSQNGRDSADKQGEMASKTRQTEQMKQKPIKSKRDEKGYGRQKEKQADKQTERPTETHTTSQKNEGVEEDIPYGEDKWAWLCKKYKVIHPFPNQGDYIMIAPKDLLFLPSQYQKLVNNSFLLHGYYNYRHLILGKYKIRRVEKFYLGVPGNYYTREQMVADMFGFEGFEKSGTGETAQGSFGYYMKEVEL